MRHTRRFILTALALAPAFGAAGEAPEVRLARLSPDFEQMLEGRRRRLRELRAQMEAAKLITPETSPAAFAQLALERRRVARSEADAQCIGVLVGDEMVRAGEFQWLVVTDQWGTEPVVCHRLKEVFAAPLSSVLKRFERGETDFSVADLITDLRQGCLEQVPQAGELPPELQA